MSAAERNELAIPATLQFDIRLPELPGATGIGMNDSAPNERELFIQLLELQTASERQAFFERHCGSNTTLRARLLELLAAHEEAGNFLQGERGPARKGQYSEADSNAMISEGPGSAIGRYRLLEKIGEGGFGIVYLAEQRAPVKRRVALKIIKLGMDTRQVVGRFEAERQVLALMDHPHIAKVLDAGAAETGRPYFVMELVNGIPITDFCDENSLSAFERLRLFISVCQAIQHAHQKGIIHRDLKPSNVMITMIDGEPAPKVIDFGVAKAIEQRLTERTLFTSYGQMIGTPAYMSPEQAELSGQDVDTRSDIYSLGCLLYELLTGTPPIDQQTLRNAGMDEIRRLIRETDPPRPSTRIARLAIAAPSSIANRKSKIENDLDWIVMKALEKDRSRRYESASALAQDIERYLKDEPVAAAAPQFGYRFRKFARRHRAAMTVSAAILFLLVGGIMATIYQAVRASRAERQALHYLNEEYKQRRAAELADRETSKARQLAEREAAVARAVVQFLNEDIFSGADPAVHPDRGFTVEDLLQRARRRVGERFAGQPLVAAAVRHTLATTLYTLGDFRSALEQVELACQLRREHLGSDARETLDSMVMLAWLTGTELNWQTGRELAEEAVDRATSALGRSHPTTLDGMSRLAWIYYRNRDTKSECRELIAETVQLARESPGVSPRVFLRSLQLHGRMDRPGEGEDLFREALDYARQSLGHHHPWTVNARAALAAYLYDWTDKMDEAEEHCRAALLDHIRMFGESHPNSLVIRANLKLILWKQQRWQEVLQHELKHFELARHPLKNLEHLKESLNKAPLGDAGGKVQWSNTSVAPDPGWTKINYNGAGWRPELPSRAAQVWLRGDLQLAAPGAWTPVFILRSSGRFSIWINGVPANRLPPHSDGTMQILAPDRQARASLRAGPNVIAIQGEGLNPNEPLQIEILEGPALGEHLYPAGLPLDSM
jgi:eukaryotic-like serine/threonine-protein kinase